MPVCKSCSMNFRTSALRSRGASARHPDPRSRSRPPALLRLPCLSRAAVPDQLQDRRLRHRDAGRPRQRQRHAEARLERAPPDRVHGSVRCRARSWASRSTARARTFTGPGRPPSTRSTRLPFNELVSSWNSKTSPGTWIQSEVRPRLDNGHWAKWYILGRWTYSDDDFHRTSVGGQGDADGFVVDRHLLHEGSPGDRLPAAA